MSLEVWAEDEDEEQEAEDEAMPIEDKAILDSQLEPIEDEAILDSQRAPEPIEDSVAPQALALTGHPVHPVLMTPGEFVSKWGNASSWTDGPGEAQAVQAAQGGAQGAAAHSDSDGRDSECMLLEPSSLELLEPAWEECMSEIRSHRDGETDDGGDSECRLLPNGHYYLAEIQYFSKFRSQKTTTR